MSTMMANAHTPTPGPWKAISDPYEDGTPYFRFEAGDPYGPRDEMGFTFAAIMRADDARLIASAPDLLEVCRYLVDFGDHENAIEKARAAIARAEGTER